jgi:hypothetical protein
MKLLAGLHSPKLQLFCDYNRVSLTRLRVVITVVTIFRHQSISAIKIYLSTPRAPAGYRHGRIGRKTTVRTIYRVELLYMDVPTRAFFLS